MPIPDARFSGCCDWGTDLIGRTPPEKWYIPRTVLSGTNALTAYLKPDGAEDDTQTFSEANGLNQVVIEGSTPYFYRHRSGYFDGTANRIAVEKYDFFGTLQWRYVDTALNNISPGSYGRSICVDTSGNVYFVGSVTSGDQLLRLRKLDSDGNSLLTFDVSPDSGFNHATGLPNALVLTLGPNGEIYLGAQVSSKTVSNDGGEASYLYDSSGSEIWRAKNTSGGTAVDGRPQCTVISDDGSTVYVVLQASAGELINLRARDASDGSVSFEKSSPFGPSTANNEMASDIFGSLFYLMSRPTTKTVKVACYSGSTLGTEEWSQTFDYTSYTLVSAQDLRCDPSGDVFATVFTFNTSPSLQYFGHRIRLDGTAGTVEYNLTDDESANMALVPPGYPTCLY